MPSNNDYRSTSPQPASSDDHRTGTSPYSEGSYENTPPVVRPGSVTGASTPVSLSQHYLPQKFAPLTNVRRRRPGRKITVPKYGGGRDAFRSGEARMPDANDEDYDGVMDGPKKGSSMKWTRFKWVLFVANLLLTIYSLIGLVFCLLTWFNVWHRAEIILVGNNTELIISTIAAVLGVLTSLVGWAGILLNNRAFLAVYTFLLWVCFAFLVAPGYLTYKQRTFNLEGKINRQWSRDLKTEGRARVQNQLHCCGYFSPFVEATVTQACYARSNLPGCKGPYIRFQRMVLERWYTVSFSLVPLHLFIMIAGLLCSNHVTYRFGKGLTPKAYRLSTTSMAVIMDDYAARLADEYGAEVASDVLMRSRSDIQLGSVPQLGAVPQLDYNRGH